METILTPAKHPSAAEQVCGYVLEKRIGSGGYGEVWSAVSPGGLKKALKFVFGAAAGERASRELAALERIKEVHHPFVLSLERIEVWNEQLVIVTELADTSLKDRFQICCDQGRSGIPRNELLIYLSDAADALDFIHDAHSLQHLDIKPENLLLMGSHAKIGDFGLVKDLAQTSASMVGGMSPIYSPPELFDGKPNQHSDQYSLAIVYQEMLTGRRPFEGRTAAQLAAQHLHSPPDLSALPLADQAVIGRALSKQPSRRFPSCRDLIKQLFHPHRPAGGAPANLKGSDAAHTLDKRLPYSTSSGGDTFRGTTATSLPPVSCRNLPAIQVDQTDWLRPTLVIGIGGTASGVLRHLHSRLAARFGTMRYVPTLQTLLLDTDSRVARRLPANDPPEISGHDSLCMPLRSATDYREHAPNLLSWISRRWLYNIPRSRRTEGIRALGRLAFVDHLEDIVDRLNQMLACVMSEESIATTERNTGLKFQSHTPRVLVVASIAGGTGGGATLDLAYAIRGILQKHQLPDEDLIGILTHATSRKSGPRDLATANAYACLSELNHYSDLSSLYPGIDANLVPGFNTATPPFSDAYLVHLGEELSQQQYSDATDMLASYLYLNIATPAANVFDKLRRDNDKMSAESLSLRTFGLRALSKLNESTASIPRWLAEAKPRLGDCARSRRLLVTIPESERVDELLHEIERHNGSPVTTISGCGEDINVCSEMQDLSLPHVLQALTGGEAEFEQVASRLHTRVDIEWMPLRR
ncbi:MAG TPA: tubulin-like doman-containing protein [Pirellulales bacterium]|jgi:serine/threonine protein kinase